MTTTKPRSPTRRSRNRKSASSARNWSAWSSSRKATSCTQKVETGIADTNYIEIKSGIKPGDEVVSGSYTAISRKLKDGSKVAIEKAKT